MKIVEPDCFVADYQNPAHANAIIELMQHYAQDPMGGGMPLTQFVEDNLVTSLNDFPGAFTILAFVDGQAAGLITCIPGFSTFNCKPLLNIHDVVVDKHFRGNKIALKMMAFVEQEGKKRDCCKLTLEVLEGNIAARKVYQEFGFKAYELDPKMGSALFWDKKL